jgi:hypothetical protein
VEAVTAVLQLQRLQAELFLLAVVVVVVVMVQAVIMVATVVQDSLLSDIQYKEKANDRK